MRKVRRASGLAVIAACGLAVAACGGSVTISSAQSCLQQAGYGVTVVPASEVANGGAENRGPGQTGELWVGLHGARPTTIDQAAATVAFFDSPAHARSEANGENSTGNNTDAIGSVTVQPGSPLFNSVIASTPTHTRAGLTAALKSALAKIESCVS